MDTEPSHQDQFHLYFCELAEQLANSVVYILDADLRVVFAGGGVAGKKRVPVDALVGRHLADVMPPSAYAEAEPQLRATLAGSKRCYELVYPTGEVFDVRTVPFYEADGSIPRMLVFALDVTDRKQAQDTEQATAQRLQLAVQAAKVGLWDWDLHSNRVQYSSEWKRQLGYDDAEVGDEFAEWERLVHPDDLPRARETALSYAVCPWPNFEQEFRMRHKDGSYRWILAQAALVYDVNGRATRMLGSHIDITQKKQAELALSESEHFAHATLDALSAHIAIIDADGTIVAVNRAWREFAETNAPTASLPAASARNVCEGANYVNVCRAAAAAGSEEAIQWLEGMAAVAAGATDLVEFEYPCHSPSEQRWFIVRITRMDESGAPRLVIAHELITQRKLGEIALRSSETALKRSQAVAHVGHWTWDTPSNTVSWSDEMKRIFGLDPAQVAGDLNQVIARTIHPDDAERVLAMNAAVVDEQRPGVTEYRVVWQDGSVHHVRAIPADSVWDAQGHIVQLWGVVQDVTERKVRELEREELLDQLHNKAEQLVQVMTSVPSGVLLLDSGNHVLVANKRADAKLARLATYDEDARLVQLGGTDLDQLLTSPPEGQWHTLQASGRSYEVIARPVEPGPLHEGWVMILHDVTVERMVQEQLQRQERLAAVGQLAAGIAHDFNNIMSVITIYAELLGEAPGLTDKERARTITIFEQAQRATRMIRQILDFSRQSVFERQVLDLLPLLKEEEKLLKQTLPENIEIALAAPHGEYFVKADPTRMQQLTMNLAVNARDAMPRGGQLRIAVERLAVADAKHAPVPGMQAGQWVRIDVQDTGMGISPEHLPHVFEPFFTTKQPGKGTGLGLAQVYGIVAQHEGHINVTSEVGIGTTFSIYLPAHEMIKADAGTAAHALLARGQGECILLVEDDVAVRASLVALLQAWNYRVLEAADGAEALEILIERVGQVDLILSDVVMPRLGGSGLVRALRTRGLQIPAILMSGHALGEDREMLAEADVQAWVDKPPSTWLLAQAIAQALGGG